MRARAGTPTADANSHQMDGLVPAASILSDLFDLDVPVLEKVARSALVFVYLILALRLAGKREIGQLNVLDVVVLLLVANSLQAAMIGNDTTLTGGVIGATTLFAANYVFVRLTFRSRRARDLLEGKPTPLFEDGRLLRGNLHHEAITEQELLSIVRERGFAGFGDVGRIELQPNGHVVVTAREEHPTTG